jgi:hypothetical protein
LYLSWKAIVVGRQTRKKLTHNRIIPVTCSIIYIRHLSSCPAGLVAEAEEQPSRWRRRRRRMAGMMPKTIGKGAWRGWGRARELNRALHRRSSKRAGFDLDLYQP